MQRGADDDLSITARILYCVIYSYYEAQKPCYITESGTARRLGVTRMTVHRCLRELLDKEWVSRSIPDGKKRYFYQCRVSQNVTQEVKSKVSQNVTPTVTKCYTKLSQNVTPYIKDIEKDTEKEKSEVFDLDDRNLLSALKEKHDTDYSFLLDSEYRSKQKEFYSHIENFDIDAVTEDIINRIVKAKPGGPRWKVKDPKGNIKNQYWLAAESYKVRSV